MSVKYNFSQKTVLVTGGSKGIGFKIVEDLLESGAKVISISRTIGMLKELSDKYTDERLKIILCDISNWNDASKCLESIEEIHYLVNNAGFGILNNFGDIEEQTIDTIFDINVKSIINISQIIAKKWKQKSENSQSRAIVNISSQASQRAIPQHTVYCASKAAVDSLTRTMALELGSLGIRVNCVNPTAILTDLGRLYWGDSTRSESLTSRIPLGRLGEVQEVSGVVLFLLSNDASLITGATIPVDGGLWAC